MSNINLEAMKTFIVPDWIVRALHRNKLNIIDLLDYSKVRAILSIDDMAEWFYLNDKFTIEGRRMSNEYLDAAFHSVTQAQKAEIRVSVLPLSGSEEIALSANTKLSGQVPESASVYKFIPINNVLYIILSEGFITHLQVRANKDEFVKNYLKECYAMASVSDVSQHSIFDLYLKAIAS